MKQPFQLTIADVTFTASTSPDVDVVERDPVYTDFTRGPGNGPDSLEIPIRFGFEEPAGIAELPVVFDAGEAWQALKDGDETLIRVPAPLGYGRHLWIIRLDSRRTPYEIYCGPGLVRRHGDRTVVTNPLRYPLDQVLMMYLIARSEAVIVHAAGLCRGDAGVLFAGVSGAGKSTLTGLLAGRDDLLPLSDDRVVVRSTDDGVRVCGTPWPGEAKVAANRDARLDAVVVLRQAGEHGLRKLDPRETLERLLPTVSILWFDPVLAGAALGVCDGLLQRVPAYELLFRRDEGVADVVDQLF